MEEREGVGLDELTAVEELAQERGRFGNANGHDGVARLHRGEQVRDGADAADPRRDRGHLVVRTSFGELLESAHLRHVELGAGHLSVVVEVDGDLGVSLDA